jgi:hypothetical protein
VKAPLVDEPPPPPLIVPAARELARFGWTWTVLAALLLVVAEVSGAASRLDSAELILILVLLGLSSGCALGAVLLARRTGPNILYYRILEYAPPPPPGVPRETPGATTRRVLAPAVALVLALVLIAVVAAGMMLALGGQPRGEIREDIPGGALIVSAGWTLVCGLAGLRMASYFTRWQRLRGAVVLCVPLKAGTMRPVYWVDPR